MTELDPLKHSVCLSQPRRLSHSTWHEHIPFAMLLVDLLRPETIVELGTYYGDSYCAFCQAVSVLRLDAKCYAVDTWQGDPQSGSYGPEVLADLRAHHDLSYGSFSHLIQSTFDDALTRFADGTIDLLHIDGYHTYEAAKHDFEKWLPKVSHRGVILMHDIAETQGDFGVKRLWEEISSDHAHFEFSHGHGLGVLAKGDIKSPELEALFEAATERAAALRALFWRLGRAVSFEAEITSRDRELLARDAQAAGLRSELAATHAELDQINRGIAMHCVKGYHKAVEYVLPLGTLRKTAYDLSMSAARTVLNDGWRALVLKTRGWLGGVLAARRTASFPNLYRLRKKSLPVSPAQDKGDSRGSHVLPVVDVVTVTYNSARFIKDFLESIAASDYPTHLMHVVVVDNGSTDDTLKIVASLSATGSFGKFEVVSASRNLGYGPGVNQAAARGDAPFILVVNPDVKFLRDSVGRLVTRALDDDEAWLWEPRQLPHEHPKFYDPVTLETVWSSGAAFLTRRDKFEKLGGFDWHFFMYAEDVDLSFRVWNAGGKCRYVPASALWHFAYSEPGEVKPVQWYHSLRNNLLVRYRFGGPGDILKGYGLLAGLFALGERKVRYARPRLARLFFSHLGSVPAMLRWRIRNAPSAFAAYRFSGWDYEMTKLGAFYENGLYEERPLVSIVVRTMNRPAYLRNALTSLANQTYRPLEVIVIEDGPATAQSEIDAFINTPGLALKYRPLGVNHGRCWAGNEGLRMATGTFVGLLDDDDLLYPDHVEVLVRELLRRRSTHKAAYAASFEVKASYLKDIISPREYRSFFFGYSRESLTSRNLFPIQAVLFDMALFDALGGFDEGLDVLEDWDLWLRYSGATDFLPVEKTTSEFRVPEDPSVRSERQAKLAKAYRLVRVKNGIAD